ncbi:MAG: OmpA family protein [Patescibacteria group bacterium]|nr:OmpA family protein [Patescibacteria group bacterium]
MKKILVMATVLFICISFVGCATLQNSDGTMNRQGKNTSWGTAGGAIAGGLLGQVFGKNTRSTLWGAAVGAAIGGLTGNRIGAYMNQQEAEFRAALAASKAASVRREGDNLRLSFKGDIFFKTNSSVIEPDMYDELNRVSQIMNQFPQTWIEAQGHTDPRGSAEYNRVLSQKRAEAAKRYLANRGVNPSRLRATGYGESKTRSGGNPYLYCQDRRVEFLLFPMQ